MFSPEFGQETGFTKYRRNVRAGSLACILVGRQEYAYELLQNAASTTCILRSNLSAQYASDKAEILQWILILVLAVSGFGQSLVLGLVLKWLASSQSRTAERWFSGVGTWPESAICPLSLLAQSNKRS